MLKVLGIRSLKSNRTFKLSIRGLQDDIQNRNIDMKKYKPEHIRNFSIIAHIDHGKSTLADRLLEITGTISKTGENKQVLDRLEVERERGITVKAQTASMLYTHNGIEYLLNLIDTPGHVDFAYEVSRSLSACQGCLLVIDASQGIQAQTIANFYLAFEAGLKIIPVINKIDMKTAKLNFVLEQVKKTLDFSAEEVLPISAKLGTNCEKLLHEVIERIPKPNYDINKPFKALIFDTIYENYRGVVIHVAVLDGFIKKGDVISMFHSPKLYEIQEIGIICPDNKITNELYAGQVGYIVCNMRSIKEVFVGDTIFKENSKVEALPGFKKPKAMVFSGFFPMSSDGYNSMKTSIEKLCINDSSVTMTNDNSAALGHGFRLGFLGLLHMEVFNERLEKEFNQNVIVTSPNLPFKVKINNPKMIKVNKSDELTVLNPCDWPEVMYIEEMYEPIVLGTIIAPTECTKFVNNLCMNNRGTFVEQVEISSNRILMKYNLPHVEIISNFFDELKSLTSGYASFDYENIGYVASNLVKLTFSLNNVDVEELTQIVHVTKSQSIARRIVEKLKNNVPRQLYKVAVQAKLGSKVIASETIKPYRTDVTQHIYGGDKTRKTKLLKQQSEYQKQLRAIGKIKISKDIFIKILKRE